MESPKSSNLEHEYDGRCTLEDICSFEIDLATLRVLDLVCHVFFFPTFKSSVKQNQAHILCSVPFSVAACWFGPLKLSLIAHCLWTLPMRGSIGNKDVFCCFVFVFRMIANLGFNARSTVPNKYGHICTEGRRWDPTKSFSNFLKDLLVSIHL